MKNLIKMTDFVLERNYINKESYYGLEKTAEQCVSYANFLKQANEKWMFVPCVDNEIFNYSMHGNFEQYLKAKERCLFEGFEINQHEECVSLIEDYAICFDVYEFNKKTIEDLIQYDLILTPTAIKQLGL